MLDKLRQTIDELGTRTWSETTALLQSGRGLARRAVRALPLFGSSEISESYDASPVDEKHYFVIPYRLAEHDYSLYSMRCLPRGLPVLNDLPKRRVFHLPQPDVGALVERLLSDRAARQSGADTPAGSPVAQRLSHLADQIDQLDDKVFTGALLIGGLVAFVNPVAGAAIAAKAMIPSAGMLLSKFGLRAAGDTLNARAITQQANQARKQILREFHSAETQSLVNPILAELDLALSTSEEERDPLLAFDITNAEFGARDRQRLKLLTCRAITNVYNPVLADTQQQKAAGLGPEDVRWLTLIREISGGESSWQTHVEN